MPLQKKLIKSDFVRHMILNEISKFLFLTDNNCYCFVHNWISKEGLLLISNEPFLFFVSDNEEASHMKPYLEKTNVDKRGTTHEKCRMSEKWNCSCDRRGAGRATGQGMQEAKYDSMTVSRVYSIIIV